jgi:methyltransferase
MLYEGFLVGNAIEMIWESWIAARNSAALIERGAKEIAPRILPIMIFLYVMMYVGSVLEYTYMHRQISGWWIGLFLSLFALAKLFKFWAARSLGPFWTMKVLVVPGAAAVQAGPYRYIRHPNYIAVLLEIAATALLGKAFLTAAVVLVLFLLVLYFRIRSEEAALAKYTDYAGKTATIGRFIP